MKHLLLGAALVMGCKGQPHAPAADITPAGAKRFAETTDAELRKLSVAAQLADWDRATNITEENEAKAAAANQALSTYLTKAALVSRAFDSVLPAADATTQRLFTLLRLSGTPAPTDPARASKLAATLATMDGLYGKGKECDSAGKCRDLGELSDVLAKSRKPAELEAAWHGWHQVGRSIKPYYEQFVGLANEGAQTVGFADAGAMWRSRYDMPAEEMVAEADRLWSQVKPLYDDLHCYTRRKLNAAYGDTIVPTSGPIPTHLLGNMWGQDWSNIFDILQPYKGLPSPDVSDALLQQGYDPLRMTKLAESFFTSMGLMPLPASFWERSMFVKPEGRDVVCHASAWDPTFSGDVRIKMCTKVNQEDLITLHHELGHDYYFLYYHQLPTLFQDGANDGFHEAIGDTIALSITPTYLKQIGLLESVSVKPEAVINQQLFAASEKIAFLPFSLLVDKWRWDVFSGRVQPAQYNDHWWALKQQYQGIVPPGPRGEADFDPGAKYHVPGNTPYMRYFLSTILQYQFHRALCKEAGFTGPLHECSVFGSKAAGDKFKAMLTLGASKPWPDALEALTGSRQMDASAILDYFAPLRVWLAKENAGRRCGW